MSLFDVVARVMNAFQNSAAPPAPIQPSTKPEYVSYWGGITKAGQLVNVEKAKTLATAYRCGNILSDDIASLPFQVFKKVGRSIVQVGPDAVTRNTAYLLEIEPNRWMTPFIFKKTIILWLIYYGNAYVWEPAGDYREWFILDADKTTPGFTENGDLVFKTIFPNGEEKILPGVEVLHLMINSTDGLSGKSVLTYARETMGRQLGAHDTQDRLHSQGLNPTGAIFVSGELNKDAREKVKESYIAGVRGSQNAGGVLIFDSAVSKFETITMTPSDAQFLETITATDGEIANFYGMPLHKINMGKQSYESNTAQQMDYVATTLNPYLVQMEEAGRLKWLTLEDRKDTYLRFVREALLRTDAKTRSAYLKDKILSGQLSPNEARQIEDLSAYEGGDAYYIPANMAKVADDGSLIMGSGTIVKEDPSETPAE